MEERDCGFAADAGGPGHSRLRAMCHAAQLSATPVRLDRPSMPPGSHPPAWDVPAA
jgi:hypothetical protein